MKDNLGIIAIIGLLLLTCVLVIGYVSMISTVDSGSVGIMQTGGSVTNEVLQPGYNLVWPWRSITKLDCKTQKDEENAQVPTKGGMSVGIKAILLYHLDPTHAKDIVTTVGKDYSANIVTPQFQRCVRDVCGKYEAESLYNDDRAKVEAELLSRVTDELSKRGIIVEGVMLLDPVLPESVKQSISNRISADFMLQQKTTEAKAKVIEAQGVADAQNIIKKDLDDNYLKYLWIEALKESAKHNNATIYIPTGHDGMPMFKEVKDSVERRTR